MVNLLPVLASLYALQGTTTLASLEPVHPYLHAKPIAATTGACIWTQRDTKSVRIQYRSRPSAPPTPLLSIVDTDSKIIRTAYLSSPNSQMIAIGYTDNRANSYWWLFNRGTNHKTKLRINLPNKSLRCPAWQSNKRFSLLAEDVDSLSLTSNSYSIAVVNAETGQYWLDPVPVGVAPGKALYAWYYSTYDIYAKEWLKRIGRLVSKPVDKYQFIVSMLALRSDCDLTPFGNHTGIACSLSYGKLAKASGDNWGAGDVFWIDVLSKYGGPSTRRLYVRSRGTPHWILGNLQWISSKQLVFTRRLYNPVIGIGSKGSGGQPIHPTRFSSQICIWNVNTEHAAVVSQGENALFFSN